MLEDKLILKAAEEIHDRFTRAQYEKLLVELGLYSLSSLETNKSYSRRTKRSLILTTLQSKENQSAIINRVFTERGFSKELVSLLISAGYDFKKVQDPDLLVLSLENTKGGLQLETTTANKVSNNSAYFILPIIVFLISLVLLLLRILDFPTFSGILTLVFAILAFADNLLRSKINQKIVGDDIRRNAFGIFLTVAGIFFVALLISQQKSKDDVNKQNIGLNRNYDDAISTLSVYQAILYTKQAELNDQVTQVSNMKSTQVAQDNYIAHIDETATQMANKLYLLESTLGATPSTKVPTVTLTSISPECASVRPRLYGDGFAGTITINSLANCSTNILPEAPIPLAGTYSNIPPDTVIWILAYAPDGFYYPQSPNPCGKAPPPNQRDGIWDVDIYLGKTSNKQESFDIVVVLADQFASDYLSSWLVNTCPTFGGIDPATLAVMNITEKAFITVWTE